jgi:DNA modification methylase
VTPYATIGATRLYLGDAAEIVPQLEMVDLVLTDPPYAAGASRSEWRTTASVAIALRESAAKVRKGGAMLAFTTTSGRGIEFTLGAVGGALAFNRLLIWHKAFVNSRVAGPWRWDAVSILCFGRASWGRPEYSSVFKSAGPSSKANRGSGKHPAELPDGVADWLFTPFAAAEPVTLDSFCGTGQLLAPAHRLGLPCVGIDIEERHLAEAGRRLEEIST